MTDDIVIVGAGPCGLTLSSRLPGRTVVFEQSDSVGGLCRSLEFGGAVFDLGGHSFHTPHPIVDAFIQDLMGQNWSRQRRDARVLFDGKLIDYPFQQNVSQISDETIRKACEARPIESYGSSSPNNFHDWIRQEFGSGVADHFMLPYNEKLWARDLREMGCAWVGERVASKTPAPSPGGAAAQQRRTPLEARSEVAYPSQGGFGAIFESLARRCGPIELSQRVVAIDTVRKTVTTDRGVIRRWDRLVSTMPLPELLSVIDDCPQGLIDHAAELQYVSLKIVMIAVNEAVGDQPQRVYCADAHVPAHKIAFNHTSSPSLRARPTQGVICEVSYSTERPPRPDEETETMMVDWLRGCRFISPKAEISAAKTVDIKYGYPVPTNTLQSTLAEILQYLQSKEIHSIGRFGAWEYINSDACIWQAMQLADKLNGAACQPAENVRIV